MLIIKYVPGERELNMNMNQLCKHCKLHSGGRYYSRNSIEIVMVLQIIYIKAFNLYQNNVDAKMMVLRMPIYCYSLMWYNILLRCIFISSKYMLCIVEPVAKPWAQFLSQNSSNLNSIRAQIRNIYFEQSRWKAETVMGERKMMT